MLIRGRINIALPKIRFVAVFCVLFALPYIGVHAQDIGYSIALQSGRACRRVALPFKRKPKIRALKNNWRVAPPPLPPVVQAPVNKPSPAKVVEKPSNPADYVVTQKSIPSPTVPSQAPPANGTPSLERMDPIKPRNAKQLAAMKKVEAQLSKQTSYTIPSIQFISGQDEFAVVNMEPFMLAVEFALQGRLITIEGHTDDIGDDYANFELSLARVEKIKKLMEEIGVPGDRILTVGSGEWEPIADNSTPEGRQMNRRVEFKVD